MTSTIRACPEDWIIGCCRMAAVCTFLGRRHTRPALSIADPNPNPDWRDFTTMTTTTNSDTDVASPATGNTSLATTVPACFWAAVADAVAERLVRAILEQTPAPQRARTGAEQTTAGRSMGRSKAEAEADQDYMQALCERIIDIVRSNGGAPISEAAIVKKLGELQGAAAPHAIAKLISDKRLYVSGANAKGKPQYSLQDLP
jgi:hypothetical protein